MALLKAPYNNSMRLGQGFNSFTQEICIDDAVVVSAHRAETVLTNDGMTMRKLCEQRGQRSLYSQTKEILIDEDRIRQAREARDYCATQKGPVTEEEEKLLARQQQVQTLMRKDAKEERAHVEAGPPPPPYRERQDNFYAALSQSWKLGNIGGPSQSVEYTSKFVEKMSEITNDLAISASLSIKAKAVEGSGRGSFINSDTVHDSDLNYYLSVRVTNQTTNFKDPLEFNPLPPSAGIDESNFVQTYGDSFISGFLEGGEFTALVSMKILNKAKLTDIKAAAKVVFNSGAIGVEAQAAFAMAKTNLTLNTETTIYVNWSGGGVIKAPSEPWTIESLMRAAFRFPENVAQSPQRTYAVLTKYDNLRSFLALKPPTLKPFNYEHVHQYTDGLLDSFLAYKALSRRLTDDIRGIQQGWKKIVPRIATSSDDIPAPFEDSIDGLEQAQGSIRKQISGIINRVEYLTEFPSHLTFDAHLDKDGEQFQSYPVFWSRLPKIESAKKKSAQTPLTGVRIGLSKKKEADAPVNEAMIEKLCELTPVSLGLNGFEEGKIQAALKSDAEIGARARMTRPVGLSMTTKECLSFFSLDFAKPTFTIKSITVGMRQSRITSVVVVYKNGLQWRKGAKGNDQRLFTLDQFDEGEMVISVTIGYGRRANEERVAGDTIVSLSLYTNLGRRLSAEAKVVERFGYQSRYLDGILYTHLGKETFDCPLANGGLLGLYGISIEEGDLEGLYRLGCIWSKKEGKPEAQRQENGEGQSANLPPEYHFTSCEILRAARLPAQLLVESVETFLTDSEKLFFDAKENQDRFAGLRFGPCVMSSATDASGSLFNDADLVDKLGSIQNYWPKRIIFGFISDEATSESRLRSVQLYYDKICVQHGADMFSMHDRLDVSIPSGERILQIGVQTSSAPSGEFSITGLSVTTGIPFQEKPSEEKEADPSTTNRVSDSKPEAVSKPEPLAKPPRSTSTWNGRGSQRDVALRIDHTVKGEDEMHGLKGFFGMETDISIVRMMAIWSL